MKLSFKEAKIIGEVFTKAYSIYSALEDIRPGGGFKEYVDEGLECKHCGAPTSEKIVQKQSNTQQLKADSFWRDIAHNVSPKTISLLARHCVQYGK